MSRISSAKIIIVIFPVSVIYLSSNSLDPSHASIQCRVRSTLHLPVIDTPRVSTDTSNHHSRSTELGPFHDHRGYITGRQPKWEISPHFHLQSDIDHLPLGTTTIRKYFMDSRTWPST
ncbi:hypothetical protein EDD22DRAFT_925332 [Suillus occidentalis]|nr:hypothetical protein EDD22DRAFT_925332 [Suillus occidentalis]